MPEAMPTDFVHFAALATIHASVGRVDGLSTRQTSGDLRRRPALRIWRQTLEFVISGLSRGNAGERPYQ
jgi:hypothetical protein